MKGQVGACTSPHPTTITSLFDGALPGGSDILIWPVDHFNVSAETVVRIAGARALRGIVVPCHRGAGGHPTMFPYDLVPDILALDDSGGLNRMLRLHSERVHRLDVNDPGVVRDVDRPADL